MIQNYNSYNYLPSHFPTNFYVIDEKSPWNNYKKKFYSFQKYIIIFGLLTLLDIITYYCYWNYEGKVFNRYLILTFVVPFFFMYLVSISTDLNKKWIAKLIFLFIITLILVVKIFIFTLLDTKREIYFPIMMTSMLMKLILTVFIVKS